VTLLFAVAGVQALLDTGVPLSLSPTRLKNRFHHFCCGHAPSAARIVDNPAQTLDASAPVYRGWRASLLDARAAEHPEDWWQSGLRWRPIR